VWFSWGLVAKPLLDSIRGSGIPSWAAVPQNTHAILWVNFQEVRDTELSEPFGQEMPHLMLLGIDRSDIEEAFGVGTGDSYGMPYFLARTAEDIDLKERVSKVRGPNPPLEVAQYLGFDYVTVSSSLCIAKTATRTLCVAFSQDLVKAGLRALKAGNSSKLDDDLQLALRNVSHSSGYYAAELDGRPPGPNLVPSFGRQAKASAVGLSIKSRSYNIEACQVFGRASEAEEAIQEFHRKLEQLERDRSQPDAHRKQQHAQVRSGEYDIRFGGQQFEQPRIDHGKII